MTYTKLIESLDHIRAIDSDSKLLFILFTIVSSILALLAVLNLVVIIKESKTLKRGNGDKVPFRKALYQKLKEYFLGFPCLLFATGVTLSFAISFHNMSVMTLEMKQTMRSTEVANWESGKDFKAYLKSLPIHQMAIDEDEIKSTNFGVEVPISYKGGTEDSYIDTKDVYKVRKEELRKDEPKHTYLEYIVIPKNITYNYQKGKIIPLKLVQVW